MENSFSQPLTLMNCIFQSNQAEGASNVFNGGGAIYHDVSRLTAVNCLFSDNDSDSVGGAMNIKWALAGVRLINCTFANNKSKQKKGSDVYAWDNANVTIANCIVWSGGGTTIDRDVNGHITVSNSCIRDGYTGRGNIQTDPRFAGTSANPFQLPTNSPCVNTGDSSALPTDAADLDDDGNLTEVIALDLSGKQRRLGEVDMGAYESQQK